MHLEMCFETTCFRDIRRTEAGETMQQLIFPCTRIERDPESKTGSERNPGRQNGLGLGPFPGTRPALGFFSREYPGLSRWPVFGRADRGPIVLLPSSASLDEDYCARGDVPET